MDAHAKCHMDRSMPEAGTIVDAGNIAQKIKGRPIGLLMAWLLHASESKLAHKQIKTQMGRPAYHDVRKQARKDLWEKRHENPNVLELFSVEVQDIVPADFADAPQLWEPAAVF